MRIKNNFRKVIRFLFIISFCFLLLSILFQLNFTLKENSKVLGKKNLLLFILTKKLMVKKIFEDESDVIKVNFKIDFKKLEIIVEKLKDEPVAIICSKECFYLSKYSYIYKPKDNRFSINRIKIFSANPVYENSYLLPNITLALAKIFEYSNLKLLPLKEVYILSNLDLKIRTQNFYFLVDPFQDINQQLKKLSFFLDNYKNSPFSQIDLRIPQKIFFK